MKKASFAGLLVVALAAASFLQQVSCGTDTCRIEFQAASDGDPIPIGLCASCNRGNDPQGAETIAVTFLPNAPDVGCRCIGATCVFCKEDCQDEECEVEVFTNEASGCTDPEISLDLDEQDFEEGARVPVTINATSRLGDAMMVVNLIRATPTPTPTNTPVPTATPVPTNTPLLGL